MTRRKTKRCYPPSDPSLPELGLRPLEELTHNELMERCALNRAMGVLRLCISALESCKKLPMPTKVRHQAESACHHANIEVEANEHGVVIL